MYTLLSGSLRAVQVRNLYQHCFDIAVMAETSRSSESVIDARSEIINYRMLSSNQQRVFGITYYGYRAQSASSPLHPVRQGTMAAVVFCSLSSAVAINQT